MLRYLRTLILVLTPPLLIVGFSSGAFASCTSFNLEFDTATASGDTLRVPVLLDNPPTDITSMWITVELDNADEFTLLTSEIMKNSDIPSSYTLSFNTTGSINEITLRGLPGGAPFSFSDDPAELFEIVLTGDLGTCTDLSFTVTTVNSNGQNCTPGNIDAQTECIPSFTISGVVEKIPDTKDVPGAEVMALNQNDKLTMVESDQNGDYSLEVGNGDDIDLSADKSEGNGCGLTSFDISLMEDHILMTNLFNDEYQYFAADANGSGTITTLDVVEVRRVILGVDPSLDIPWVVIPGSNYSAINIPPPSQSSTVPSYDSTLEFNSVTQDLSGKDFFGVKVGDVSGSGCDQDSIAKSAGVELLAQSRITGRQPLRLQNVQARAGETMLIPVYSQKFRNQRIMSLGLQFAAEAVEVIDLVKPALPDFTEEAYTVNHDRPGAIDILWFVMEAEGISVKPDQALFYIKARARRDIGNLSKLVSLRSARTENWIYDANSNIEEVQLEFLDDPAPEKERRFGNKPLLQTNGVRISPNPFTDRVRLQLATKQPATAEIEILSLNGALLRAFDRELRKGENQIVLDQLDNLPSGYLTYRIILPNRTLAGKILKMDK